MDKVIREAQSRGNANKFSDEELPIQRGYFLDEAESVKALKKIKIKNKIQRR